MKRLPFLFLLFACFPAFAGDPVVAIPTTKQQTTVVQANAAPGPITVEVGRFVPLIPTVADPLLYLVDGDGKAVKEYLRLPGEPFPGIAFDEPAGATEKDYKYPNAKGTWKALKAMAPGKLTIRVLQNGKDPKVDPPTELQTIQIIVTGHGPQPPPIPPDPPSPVPIGSRYIVVVEPMPPLNGVLKPSYMSDIAAKLKAKGHVVIITQENAVDAAGQIPGHVKPYIELSRGKPLPNLFIVENKSPMGIQLYAGPLPATADEFLKLLTEKGG